MTEPPILAIKCDHPEDHSSGAPPTGGIRSIIDAARNEGLLDRASGQAYMFPHDQIQHALCAKLDGDPEEQQLLHLRIGSALLQLIEEEQTGSQSTPQTTRSDTGSFQSSSIRSSPFSIGSRLSGTRSSYGSEISDTVLFVAVDNMNKGSNMIIDPDQRMSLASLNYDAAKAALCKTAVEGAAQYVRHAQSLLGDDQWESRYDLCLDVWTLAARLEHSVGNHEKRDQCLHDIQTYATTVLDRLPSVFIEIDALASKNQIEDALRLGCEVLTQLGEPMRVRPGLLQLMRELRKTTALMKSTMEAGFDTLPFMTEPLRHAALSVLVTVSHLCYTTGVRHKNLMVICILRMAKISCLYGLSPLAPYSVMGFAVLQENLGDMASARETAMISLDLIDKIPGADATAGRTTAVVWSVIGIWCGGKVLPEIQPIYIRCHHMCMAHGDIDLAFFPVYDDLNCDVIRGTPIAEVDAKFQKNIGEMDDYNMNHIKVLTLGPWRVVRLLTGRGDYTVDGDLIDVTALYEELKNVPEPEQQAFVDAFKIVAKVVLDEYGSAETLVEDEKLIKAIIKYSDAPQFHVSRALYDFALGVGSMKLFAVTRKRKYRGASRQVFQWLSGLHKHKAPLSEGLYQVFVAEQLAQAPTRRNKWEATERTFLQAIEACRQNGGFAAVEGYSYERLAKLASIKERSKEDMYLREALAVYKRWGASEKVTKLQRTIDGARYR